jgi:vitamin K-dependent gamma-carboxylase
MPYLKTLILRYNEPVSILPLALFRIVYGAILVICSLRYFYRDYIFQDYIEPTVLFPMLPWIPRLPDMWMCLPFVGMLVGAVGILLGWRFRFHAWLFCISWLYVFVMDVSLYNNHYYLMVLLTFLLAITDSHRLLSLDVRRVPHLKTLEVPAWQLFLFQFQVGVLYFYGGLSKIHPQWLDGTIMHFLAGGVRDHYLLGPVFANDVAIWVWTYTGLFFDLGVGFLLFWKPTRRWALWGCVGFHLLNEFVLFSSQSRNGNIGMFPMMGLAMCLVFLDKAAYASFFLRVRGAIDALLDQRTVSSQPALKSNPERRLSQKKVQPMGPWVVVFIGIYMLVQVGLPFRRMLFPDYLWTREGLLFGWTMKLSTYPSRNIIRFKLQDPDSGLSMDVDLRNSLTYRQYLQMCHSPYMVWLYAQYISEAQYAPMKHALARQGKPMPSKLEVYVYRSEVALHTPTVYPLIDPNVNLAAVDYKYWSHNEWILLRR